MMCRSRRVMLGAWVLGACALSVSGCSAGKRDVAAGPAAEAKVAGKITVKGRPATRGKVTFEPPGADGNAAPERIADIQKDGTFQVNTLVGSNHVIIGGTGDPAAGSYNTTTVDVKPGDNTLDLDLPLDR